MTRVLVTGATGFLGFHVAKLLNERGVRPRVLELRGVDPAPLTRLDVERCPAPALRSLAGAQPVGQVRAELLVAADVEGERLRHGVRVAHRGGVGDEDRRARADGDARRLRGVLHAPPQQHLALRLQAQPRGRTGAAPPGS
jgi:nucleoside-diphosphate-sugar epimerase